MSNTGILGCTPSFCVPEICTFTSSPAVCENIKPATPTYEELYAGLYISGLMVPNLVVGVQDNISTQLSSLIVTSEIVRTLPYLITFIILFIILIRTRVLTFDIGVLLIVLILVLTGLTIFFVTQQTASSLEDIINSTQQILIDNWNNNSDQFRCNLEFALLFPFDITCKTSDAQLAEKYRQLGCSTCK